MEGIMKRCDEKKIVVAIDESEESMYALSWCLNNLTAHNNKECSTLVLLYVKPPPPIYSPLDAAGYMFSKDVISTLDKYGSELVKSVMRRADAVYRDHMGYCCRQVNVERRVGTGDAKDVICGTVEKLGADILVMGRKSWLWFLQKSFARKCQRSLCQDRQVSRRCD